MTIGGDLGKKDEVRETEREIEKENVPGFVWMDAGNEKRQSSLASVVFTDRNRKIVMSFEKKGKQRKVEKEGIFPETETEGL